MLSYTVLAGRGVGERERGREECNWKQLPS